ncbi:hypothetical protein KJ652_02155 [Patescibacteria group bacterium]|nr:hypothetical protein [Patescibacteria group bacterium]MBU1123368.1 hypothetical protein [Patescibacteria group bacterium]MBU1911660.1 hypothetical protein [Patescibacteria group bacterium]
MELDREEMYIGDPSENTWTMCERAKREEGDDATLHPWMALLILLGVTIVCGLFLAIVMSALTIVFDAIAKMVG